MPKRSEDTSFFTIIPVSVLHDESLNPNAKLLYAEITGLTKQTGYCWAQNQHFAKLFKTSERSIIRWINDLQANGHISVHYQYFPNSKKIAKRLIYCTFSAKKPAKPHQDGEEKPHIYPENFDLPNPPEGLVVTGVSPPEGLVVTGVSPPEGLVVTGVSPPEGDRDVTDNNIRSNRSSSSDPPGIEKRLSVEEEGFEITDNYSENCALENSTEKNGPQTTFDIPSLKRLLKELDPSFVFSGPFYQKALDFMASNGLDSGYASWLREFCVKQNPTNIANYFYKVLFDARCAELYLAESRPPPAETFKCPACSAEHGSGLLSCPSCGLGLSSREDRKEIYRRKRLFEMPPDAKAAYDEEFDKTRESIKSLGLKEQNFILNGLDRKYGLVR